MGTRITNIVLDGDRFRVFATVNGNDEVTVFPASVTALDIRTWLDARVAYYEELLAKEAELKDELLGGDA